MKKIFFFLLAIPIILLIIFLAIYDELNANKLLANIQKDTNLIINLEDGGKWKFYPSIEYASMISAKGTESNVVIDKSKIRFLKNYWPLSPLDLELDSPSIQYEGLILRNSRLKAKYSNKIIDIRKFNAKLNDGDINTIGKISVDENKSIQLNGSFNNISLNTIFAQKNIARWDRVNIKIASPRYNLVTTYKSKEMFIASLNGLMKIKGSVFFNSTEEERFGAALLSLLVDKVTSLSSVSKSISYLLDKFADVPSAITGELQFINGTILTKDMLLQNNSGRALITAEINMLSNSINGKINFFEENSVFLEAVIKGNIQNPEILIGGEVFAEDGSTNPRDIKKIFQDGIQSLVNSLIEKND
ncbi:AsmA-like C-terminal region-containing protein [Alphaproteobacteria bacterium]|nr:AsmA-like C-terminal region-containing protein [Alphaproteobacteria bacterium]